MYQIGNTVHKHINQCEREGTDIVLHFVEYILAKLKTLIGWERKTFIPTLWENLN